MSKVTAEFLERLYKEPRAVTAGNLYYSESLTIKAAIDRLFDIVSILIRPLDIELNPNKNKLESDYDGQLARQRSGQQIYVWMADGVGEQSKWIMIGSYTDRKQ